MNVQISQCQNEIDSLLKIGNDVAGCLDDLKTHTLIWHYIIGKYYHLLKSYLQNKMNLSKEQYERIRSILYGQRSRSKRTAGEFYEIINLYPSLLLSGVCYSLIIAMKAQLFALDANSPIYNVFHALLPDIAFSNKSTNPFLDVNKDAGKCFKNKKIKK